MAHPMGTLAHFEARRTALLDELETMDPEHLNARPRPGKWSILEIVEHLVVAEQDVLRNPADPATPPLPPWRPRHLLAYPSVLLVLRYGIPVRAPSRAMLPRGGQPLDELRRRWDAHQAWFREWLAGVGRRELRRRAFAHPVAGPLRPAQAVRILHLHLGTHIRQIRTLQQLSAQDGWAPGDTGRRG